MIKFGVTQLKGLASKNLNSRQAVPEFLRPAAVRKSIRGLLQQSPRFYRVDAVGINRTGIASVWDFWAMARREIRVPGFSASSARGLRPAIEVRVKGVFDAVAGKFENYFEAVGTRLAKPIRR